MTARIRNLATVTLVLLVAFACAAQQAPTKSGGVKLAPYKKLVLKNGMTVLLMEQHKVPLVSVNYIVRSGAVTDPVGKEGLASLAAGLLRKGTKTRTADQISESLDFIGATYAASASLDYSSGRAEFLKKDAVNGLDIVADLLMNPAFPEPEVKKMLAQRIDAIKSGKDQAQRVISEYYYSFLFGNNPYGRPTNGDEKSLANITRDDVVKFHSAAYIPANTILAVVGDFNTAEMEKMIADHFGVWSSTAKPAPFTVPAPKPVTGKHLLLVDKPDSTQTYYMVGNVGVSRSNPDRVGIEVVNVLFGGRFTSLINSALRIKNGLTYGARSDFDMRKAAGPFFISTYTRNATTEKALDMTLEVLHQFREKGITEADLNSAKAYIKGTLPPEMLETSDQLAAVLTQLQFYGEPDSEINDYYAKVDALTLTDAKRIISTYYPEDNLTFVLIGKASEIGPVVKKYAPDMKTKSITEVGF
jgi:zinc protease